MTSILACLTTLLLVHSVCLAQVAPPQPNCEAEGCVPQWYDVNDPPAGLNIVFGFQAGTQKGTCGCSGPGHCDKELDCVARPKVTVLGLPNGTNRIQNIFTQGAVGDPNFAWYTDLVMNCVSANPPVTSTAQEIRVCLSGTNNPGGGNPWLFNISGFAGTTCGAEEEPLWTYHFYAHCPPCGALDDACP
jgi:hypothetical protein